MPSLQYSYIFHALMIKSLEQAQQGYIKSQKLPGILHMYQSTYCLSFYVYLFSAVVLPVKKQTDQLNLFQYHSFF